MKPSTVLTAAVLSLALCSAGSSTVSRRIHVFRYENVLGTSFELKVLAPTADEAAKAETAALREIDRESDILSGYNPASEFSRWMKTSGEPVRVSPELFEVLSMFDHWRTATAGALDPAAETLTRVWKTAAAANRMPTDAEIAHAVQTIHRQHWALDPYARTAAHLTDAPLVLNSFAKTYIVNRAAAAAMNAGDIGGVVLNIGGDLVVRGNLTEQVDIADPYSDAENSRPIATISVHDRAVATSGNYRRGVEIGGRHYSHIFDPRTGQPADDIVSSTVVASNAADAGALATAFSVLTPAETERLASSMPGVEYLLVRKNGTRVASRGWSGLAAASRPAPVALYPAAAAAATTWDPSLELTVNVEIAHIEGNRVRRPYVAVWIEDQDKFPVRTIGLWIEKTRYLNEMKAWYKDDRLRAMSEGTEITKSVSGATRPPGKYSFKWDGKDNSGKLVKPGTYNVMIEAAREHGTYQLIHQEVEFTGTPKQIQLPGGTEISSASLDYHKVGR